MRGRRGLCTQQQQNSLNAYGTRYSTFWKSDALNFFFAENPPRAAGARLRTEIINVLRPVRSGRKKTAKRNAGLGPASGSDPISLVSTSLENTRAQGHLTPLARGHSRGPSRLARTRHINQDTLSARAQKETPPHNARPHDHI